ncbi:ras GEF [Hesseltinella vesiculosa]|uniref:Ras GEF n=1 Tax=Hesseltinella vesiculosa TaxID=101127 RepID=A0A1X2GJK4_9FUNG|nr:ras GEF [Hesseltinella vesiculosa]
MTTDQESPPGIFSNPTIHPFTMTPKDKPALCSLVGGIHHATLKSKAVDQDLSHAVDVSLHAMKAIPSMAWWSLATFVPPCSRPPCSKARGSPSPPAMLPPTPPLVRPSSSIATADSSLIDCGFVYAPTVSNPSIHPSHDLSPSSSSSCNDFLSIPELYPGTRRGSKDSSESITPGLTIDCLVDRLVAHDGDEQMITIFLIFFRKFMKPHDLIKTLVDRFEHDMDLRRLPTPTQQRICHVLESWMTNYWNDFISFPTRSCLHGFLDRISRRMPSIYSVLHPLALQPLAETDPDDHWGLTDRDLEARSSFQLQPVPRKRSSRQLRVVNHSDTQPLPTESSSSLLSPTSPKPTQLRSSSTRTCHTTSSASSLSSSARPTPCFAGHLLSTAIPRPHSNHAAVLTPAACTVNAMPMSNTTLTKIFSVLTPMDMAEQLTWVEARLFSQIKAREFVRMVCHTHDNRDPFYTNKNALMASISHFNFISAWVITMLVTQPRLSKRVLLLEKFMMIAVELRDLNNYNTLMALLAGINNASILRLKHTQAAIEKRKIFKRFQSLERLMSSDRSFASYRLALKASSRSPHIPYFGIHSQDLIALAEANKDFKKDSSINWEKFRLMGECILTVMRCQHPKHHIRPNSTFLRWLANYEILGDEDHYKQSKCIEPQLKSSSSMGRLRDFWQRL